MARPLRIEYPGAFYHVISRGNAGDPIYKSRRDRERFIEYLAISVERFGIQIHTYCLMTNHYHLLVETPEPNLSRAIHWLNVSYATYFNHKRDRCGHLFHGRFRSILVEADTYLKQVSRYIHLNPIRANMVDTVADHEWSSYPAIIGRTNVPVWLAVDWLLRHFDSERKIAQRKYQQFVEEMDFKSIENPYNKVVSNLILGTDEFVKWVKSSFLSDRSLHPELPQLRELKPRCSIDRIIEVVANRLDSTKEEILEKGRKKNLARDIAIYFSKSYSGKSGNEIAQLFKLGSGSAITMRYKQALKEIEYRKDLDGKISKIKERILKN